MPLDSMYEEYTVRGMSELLVILIRSTEKLLRLGLMAACKLREA